MIAEHNPELAVPSPFLAATSQDKLLQLRSQYEAAELMAQTAEADARAAIERRTTQQLDLE